MLESDVVFFLVKDAQATGNPILTVMLNITQTHNIHKRVHKIKHKTMTYLPPNLKI